MFKFICEYYPFLVMELSLIVMAFASVNVKKEYKKSIVFILASLLISCVVGEMEAPYQVMDHLEKERVVISFLGYCVRPLIPYAFLRFVFTCTDYDLKNIDVKKVFLLYGPLVINFLMHTTMFYSQIGIHFDSQNVFHRGNAFFGYFSFYVSFYYIGLVVFFSNMFYKKRKLQETLLVVVSSIAIVIAIILETEDLSQKSVIYTSVACCYSIFLYLHIQITNDNSLKKELEIQRKNEAVMLSQIKPHFLYNTLGTIEVLCHSDAELAADTVRLFSKYLRGNMESLNNKLIPIAKELEHTSQYTAIEELRFKHLYVKYNIEDEDVMLPVLTIQPIVENAIRHGVRGRNPGVVEINTRYATDEDMQLFKLTKSQIKLYKKWHLIEIVDNGIGFDTNDSFVGEKNHIGITNVKDRVESLANGLLIIDSKIGLGTTVRILIPNVED